jgi:hypothetical protein
MFSNRISQTQTDVIPELLKPTFQSIDVQTDTPPNGMCQFNIVADQIFFQVFIFLVETGVQASVTNVAKMAQTEAPTVSDHELQTTSTMNAQNKQSPTKPPPPQQILSPVNLISELRSKNARTYCEHCELFDSHETEECPKQEALRFERTKHHVYQSNGNIIPSKSQPRLYCDKCEAFGHSATDCPKAEAAAGN